jgi:hypothetical protein
VGTVAVGGLLGVTLYQLGRPAPAVATSAAKGVHGEMLEAYLRGDLGSAQAETRVLRFLAATSGSGAVQSWAQTELSLSTGAMQMPTVDVTDVAPVEHVLSTLPKPSKSPPPKPPPVQRAVAVAPAIRKAVVAPAPIPERNEEPPQRSAPAADPAADVVDTGDLFEPKGDPLAGAVEPDVILAEILAADDLPPLPPAEGVAASSSSEIDNAVAMVELLDDAFIEPLAEPDPDDEVAKAVAEAVALLGELALAADVAPEPVVRVQPQISAGGVDLWDVTGGEDLVQDALRRRMAGLENCYAQILDVDADVAGTISLEWNVYLGRTTDVVVIHNTTGADELGACFAAEAKRWRFPQAVHGLMSWPLDLQPVEGA